MVNWEPALAAVRRHGSMWTPGLRIPPDQGSGLRSNTKFKAIPSFAESDDLESGVFNLEDFLHRAKAYVVASQRLRLLRHLLCSKIAYYRDQ